MGKVTILYCGAAYIGRLADEFKRPARDGVDSAGLPSSVTKVGAHVTFLSEPLGGSSPDSRTGVRGRTIVLGLILFGLAERVAWAVIRPDKGASGEAFNVARAIGEGRGFADAYHIGQGSTAHLLPISPGIAGAVYHLLGVRSAPAEVVLTSWSLICVFGAFLFLYRAFGKLGCKSWTRILAMAYLCVAPAYIAQEAVDFRVWEGGLTSLLTAFLLDRFVAIDLRVNGPTKRDIVVVAVVGALLFFVNPGFGLGCAVAGLALAIRKFSAAQTLQVGVVAVLTLTAMIAPWALRNQALLGSPVLLRSNAGLELALANHDRALLFTDPGAVFLNRLREIHPAASAEAYERMVAVGGEIAYSRSLQNVTNRWIADHPVQTTRLAARHIGQIFAPEPWQFSTFGSGKAVGLRASLATFSGVVGLLSLILALGFREKRWLYPLLIIVLPALALALFQPVPRYTYLFYPILTFAAFVIPPIIFDYFRNNSRARRGEEKRFD